MLFLAADTTTAVNSVAICDDSHVLSESIVNCGRAHSERLLATVDWVLEEAGLTLDRIEALAISIGPGSFTGLRVGAATWKGLALAQRLPLVGVPTLDAMTRLVPFRDGVVCPLLDARMHEVFGAVYRFDGGRREKLTDDRVCPVESLLEVVPGDAVFLGNGAALYREQIQAMCPQSFFVDELCGVPRASAVAAEAVELMSHGAAIDPDLVAPIYLRASQAEQNRAAQKASCP